MKRYLRLLAIFAVLGLVLAACGDDGGGATTTEAGDDTTTTEAGDDTTTTEPMDDTTTTAEGMIGEGRRVGMAYDIGGRGDQSFNDLAALAWDEGMATFGYEGEELVPDEGGENREENLRLLAETGHELIIANGFAFANNVFHVATEFPEANFAVTDSCASDDEGATADLDNVRCMLFAEHEGSFLVGAAAALKSETGTIGFIGGVQIPLIEKFQAGFEAGARAVNPDIDILEPVYLTQPPDFSGFGNPALGNEAAQSLYGAGADVVFHAAGGSGGGLFQAAEDLSTDDQHLWAIGVDSDQYNVVGDPVLQEHILTSMLKRVDVAVAATIEDFVNGSFTSGPEVFDLSVDGVGYSTTGGFVDDITGELDAFKDQIVNGDIVVPDTLEG